MVGAALTRNHQGHDVSLIVVTHDNLTVVGARVVGTETVNLHGSIQRIGSVSWHSDAANESLIHLDYITFGKKREVCSSQNVSLHILQILEMRNNRDSIRVIENYLCLYTYMIKEYSMYINSVSFRHWLN